MNQQLMPFDYEGREVRVVKDDQGEPWFVAADVCAVLQLPELAARARWANRSEGGSHDRPL